MNGLGLIARADNGGLGTQTWEVWRHLRPEKTLIVLARHRTRGDCHFERFEGDGLVRVTPLYPTTKDARWLTTGVDTIFSAETFYSYRVIQEAQRANVRLVLQANPELFDPEPIDAVRPATGWRMDILPDDAEVLPFPVNRELLPPRPVDRVRTFYHVNSSAMEDRNGTDLVLSALRYMTNEAKLLIRGNNEPHTRDIGPVQVQWLGPFDGPYYDHWPWAVDALVLPRRYGGLCLPAQEAASLRLPILMLDTDPYDHLVINECKVPGFVHHRAPMRGGTFDIHACRPQHLAAAMDRLIENPPLVHRASQRSEEWAREHSWDALLPLYRKVLR